MIKKNLRHSIMQIAVVCSYCSRTVLFTFDRLLRIISANRIRVTSCVFDVLYITDNHFTVVCM